MQAQGPSSGLQDTAHTQHELLQQVERLGDAAGAANNDDRKSSLEEAPGYDEHVHGPQSHLEQPEHIQGSQIVGGALGSALGEQPDSLALQQAAHAHMLGVPAGLPALQPNTGAAGQEEGPDGAKFKPIDLDRLSPKSRQRVLRNRQAATRSKAKKKQQFQLLKDKKAVLESELEQLEAQHAAAEQRVTQLHAENKALLDTCKCPKIQQ